MARKYDRYGRNRQFRRNPTRSPKFFPYRLPYQNDFRIFRSPSIQEYDDDDGLYERMQYTQTPKKRKRDDFEEQVTKGQKEIMNAMGKIMFAEAGLFRASTKAFGEPIRFFMFDEFRI